MDKRLQHLIQVTEERFRIVDERYTIQNERYTIQNERLEVLMQKILNIDDKNERRLKSVSNTSYIVVQEII